MSVAKSSVYCYCVRAQSQLQLKRQKDDGNAFSLGTTIPTKHSKHIDVGVHATFG